MTRQLSFTAASTARSVLAMPEKLEEPGLLVGWSMETAHARRPMGFTFGDPDRTPSNGFVDPILMNGEGHLITIAPTGAGKGVGCIIPALLRHDGPVIVIDPKGENTAVAARRRREMGDEVIVLDPMGLTGGPTGSLNPLDLIRPEEATGVDDAAALVTTLLPSSDGDDRNRWWRSRAQQLLVASMLHVVTDLPPEERCLARLRQIVNDLAADPEAWSRQFAASRHPEVRAIQGNLAIAARETLGGIISFAQDGVDFIRGPLVQAVTERSSFSLDAVTRGDRLSIFIVLPPHMLSSHGRLLRLWIGTLLAAVTRRRSRPAKPTLFILDEAAQLGELEELRLAVTLLRGYGLQTWSFWQDVSQVKLLYPRDWETMINNCRVIQAFGANNMNAADAMSGLVGFVSGLKMLELEPDEMLLQIAGDEAVIARRPNYRADPIFAGACDANPLFDELLDPLPEPRLLREYLRPEKTVASIRPFTPSNGLIRPLAPGPRNVIDEMITREMLRVIDKE